MRRLLHRRFEVACPRPVVWAILAHPADWPAWAGHIRSVDVEPPGLLTASSTGIVRLRNRVRSRFTVMAFVDGERWLWSGKFLWLWVEYDHVLEVVANDRTRVTFDVRVGGLGSGSLGRLFAWIYARNLDRAIPKLIAHLEARGP